MGTKNKVSIIFISLALLSLLGGVFFGVCAAFQFVYPEFMSSIPFHKLRPLHVTLAVTWIFFSAVGGIYYYLPKYSGLKWKLKSLPSIHLVLFLITGIAIIGSYFLGKFGGREYWEFPPFLAIPIIVSWLLFGLNYFQTVFSKKGKWPVYLWMWATGIFFFLFTFMESYLWIFPYFRENIVRDMTMQWKAYGALTGSWNMLVYGTAIFVMEKIKGDDNIAYSKLSYSMYFLGLVNLMFGWAHHIYNLPVTPWLRYSAYAVSMTELIILAKIIWNWRSSVSASMKRIHFLPYRFLAASDVWIFLNLVIAILISIPAVNVYTHGTHVTVAHAMGSTIGINTMILLASCLFILRDISGKKVVAKQLASFGFWTINISLVIFWVSLLTAGIYKGVLVINSELLFQEIMQRIEPWLITFAIAGLGIFAGLGCVVVPAIISFSRYILQKKQPVLNLYKEEIKNPSVFEKLKKTA